jgi:hypothetical protein
VVVATCVCTVHFVARDCMMRTAGGGGRGGPHVGEVEAEQPLAERVRRQNTSEADYYCLLNK